MEDCTSTVPLMSFPLFEVLWYLREEYSKYVMANFDQLNQLLRFFLLPQCVTWCTWDSLMHQILHWGIDSGSINRNGVRLLSIDHLASSNAMRHWRCHSFRETTLDYRPPAQAVLTNQHIYEQISKLTNSHETAIFGDCNLPVKNGGTTTSLPWIRPL